MQGAVPKAVLGGCKMSSKHDGRQDEEVLGRDWATEALLFHAKELGSST